MGSQTQPPAYVLWLGPTGLTFARSLGRAGVDVTALHHDAHEASAGTRYAKVMYLPHIKFGESPWLEFLLDEARRLDGRKAVLIPASDASWLMVAKHRHALAEHFLFALPDGDGLEQWMAKPFQYAAAERAGVPYPRTIELRTVDELRVSAERIGYPCLLKPVLSHCWQEQYGSKLAFIRNADQLIERGRDAISRGLKFMIQEYIPANDDEIYGLFVYFDRQSRPLCHCIARKLRQNPPRFGNSCLSECVDEPRVVELGLRLVRELGFHGVGSAEFKRDPRDGQFKLMEFNVRPTLLMALAVDSGVDIPMIAYHDICGNPPPADMISPRRFGRRVGIFAKDMQAARFYRERGELGRIAWLRSWLGARDTHFAWDDLGPFRGYVHAIIDGWRNGRYRELPSDFPSMPEWADGKHQGSAGFTSDKV